MKAYYNELEPFAAQWLRNLIAAGHIAVGDVDERDIRDVRPSDLAGYTQCHFFAGIGGWSYALRLAGWPDDKPVWTGSCPCQPFSAAGKGSGFDDARHLWPDWFWLISQCRPEIIFGEQVASKPGLAWFDLVSSDLEGAGYAVGANDICAAGVGAPHIRQRLWFVADRNGEGRGERTQRDGQPVAGVEAPCGRDAGGCGSDGRLADNAIARRQSRRRRSLESDGRASSRIEPGRLCNAGELGDTRREGGRWDTRTVSGSQRKSAGEWGGVGRLADQSEPAGAVDFLGHSSSAGLSQRERNGRLQREAMGPSERQASVGGSDASRMGYADLGDAAQERASDEVVGEQRPPLGRRAIEQSWAGAAGRDGGGLGTDRIDGPRYGTDARAPWDNCDWLPCTDGKARPVEPGTFPLAHGIPGRVGRLRAYGNAIVPQVAAEFIIAVCETVEK